MRECFGKPGGNSDAIFISLKSIFLSSVVFVNMTALAQSQPADSTKHKKISNQVVQKKPYLEIFGFIITDVIYDFKQMNP